MKLTEFDAFAVKHTSKGLCLLDRDTITSSEFVSSLFDDFSCCETDCGIQQCLAVVPQRLWPEIEAKVNNTLKQTHPGELFVFFPMKPTEAELAALDARVRHILAVVLDYMANPTGVVDYEIDELDIWRKRWSHCQQIETIAGEQCRKEGCDKDHIRHGIFCPAHHFEMLFGQPPPDVTE